MLLDISDFQWSFDPGGYRWKEENRLDETKPNLFLVPKRETVFRAKNGKEMAGFVPSPLWDERLHRTYPVFEREKLYLQIANTPTDKDSILRFANSFGELGGGREVAQFMMKLPREGEPGSNVSYYGPITNLVHADSFTTWCNEIKAMKLGYLCWKAYRRDDGKEIADAMRVIDAFSLSPAPDSNAWTNLSPIPKGLKGKEGLLEALTHLCNEGMRGRFSLALRSQPDKPNPVPYMQPDSLIGALWYQFSETIGNEQWRVCEYCGEPFKGRRNRKHCSNSHKTMASKRRKKRLGKPAGDKN